MNKIFECLIFSFLDKQAMIHLVDHLNSILHENNFKKTGTALLDSLLVYFCHKAQLPCRGDGKHQSTKKSWHNLSPRSRLGGKTCVRPEEISRLIRYIEIENEGLKKLSQNRKYYLLSSCENESYFSIALSKLVH